MDSNSTIKGKVYTMYHFAGCHSAASTTTVDDISQMVGGLTVYCVCIHHIISYCRLAQYLLLKTTVYDIKWSDSRRVDYVLVIHSPYHIIYCKLA